MADADLPHVYSLRRHPAPHSISQHSGVDMAKIGLFFGTQTGNTESIAQMIQQAFCGEEVVALHEIFSPEPDDFDSYSDVIIGYPTWNIGELQSDWAGFYDQLDSISFGGKKLLILVQAIRLAMPITSKMRSGFSKKKSLSRAVQRWAIGRSKPTNSMILKP